MSEALTEALFEIIQSTPQQIIDKAGRDHNLSKRFVLFSGGNDSLVLLHLAMTNDWAPDGVVHVNTGTGVPETTEFVRQTCSDWGLVLHELTPPFTYEEIFLERGVIGGLPGPGYHNWAYRWLKERPLRAFVKSQKSHVRDRIGFLTGIRHDESQNRMGYSDSIIDREGAKVWINAIYWFSDAEMRQYRVNHNLPENPVAANLHISGECLCGAFARPDELEQIRFFYPAVAERIEGWERRAMERGLKYCKWGQRRRCDEQGDLRLCRQCVGQQSMWDALETPEEGT